MSDFKEKAGFKDKAKDLAGDVKDKAGVLVDKIESRLPDSFKEKVSVVTVKIKDLIPGGDAPSSDVDLAKPSSTVDPANPSNDATP